jgi:hypothetical protein
LLESYQNKSKIARVIVLGKLFLEKRSPREREEKRHENNPNSTREIPLIVVKGLVCKSRESKALRSIYYLE